MTLSACMRKTCTRAILLELHEDLYLTFVSFIFTVKSLFYDVVMPSFSDTMTLDNKISVNKQLFW